MFVVGLLVGAWLLGGAGMNVLPGVADDSVEAQSSETWQVADFFYCERACEDEGWYYSSAPAGSSVSVPEYLESIPSSCRVEPMYIAGGASFMLFYAC